MCFGFWSEGPSDPASPLPASLLMLERWVPAKGTVPLLAWSQGLLPHIHNSYSCSPWCLSESIYLGKMLLEHLNNPQYQGQFDGHKGWCSKTWAGNLCSQGWSPPQHSHLKLLLQVHLGTLLKTNCGKRAFWGGVADLAHIMLPGGRICWPKDHTWTHMDLKERLQTTILVNFMTHSHMCWPAHHLAAFRPQWQSWVARAEIFWATKLEIFTVHLYGKGL